MGKIEARITLMLDDPRLAEAICRALEPESKQPLTERGRARVECGGEGRVTIIVSASDPGAARALINSYLYWVAGITSSIEEVSDG